jgi:hypothetical protein
MAHLVDPAGGEVPSTGSYFQRRFVRHLQDSTLDVMSHSVEILD